MDGKKKKMILALRVAAVFVTVITFIITIEYFPKYQFVTITGAWVITILYALAIELSNHYYEKIIDDLKKESKNKTMKIETYEKEIKEANYKINELTNDYNVLTEDYNSLTDFHNTQLELNETLENKINKMNMEMTNFQKMIVETACMSETKYIDIFNKIKVLRGMQLPFKVQYDIDNFKFIILTEVTMQSYTRLSIQNELLDDVLYKVKGSDIILSKQN